MRNLAKEITQKDLQTLFQGFGHIKSCKLEVFNNGESRGFGYVQFDTQDNAQKAIKALDGSDHHGKKITVQIHAKKDEREGQGDNKYTNLFVSNLPLDLSSDKLKETFKQYGQILSAEINAKSNGTGFVSFNSHEDARNALESTNRKLKIGDQVILVNQHIYRKENELQPKGGQSKPIVQTMKEQFRSNVFVKFIPNDISKEKIIEEFGKAGSIDSVKLKSHEQKINGETFSNYQIGFVLFNDIEGAQKCIRMFDQSSVFGMRPLKVDFWQSKDDLKKERTERDVNDVNQMINFCRNANRMNNQMFGMQPMYQTSGYQNQMMGDGQRQ